MTAAPPLALADRFALIIDGLCRTIAAGGGRGPMSGPLIILLWTRLRRAARRFAALAARVRDGIRPSRARPRRRPSTSVPPAPSVIPANPGDEVPRGGIHSPRPRLPRRFGWLIRLLPETACSRSQLSHFLSDPELADLLAAAPQLGLVLRRLCRMLGIRPPDHLSSFLRNLSRPPSQEQTPESQSGGSAIARCASHPPGRQPPSSFLRKQESSATARCGPALADTPPPRPRRPAPDPVPPASDLPAPA